MRGLERMYGVARFLADYYDLYAKAGIPITAAVQQAARSAGTTRTAWIETAIREKLARDS